MKKAKKLVSLLLAVVMLLSLAVSVGAAGGTTPSVSDAVAGNAENMQGEGNGKITITNAKAGHKYRLYQVLYLESFNKDTGAYIYKENNKWSTWLNSNLNGSLKDYIKKNDKGYIEWANNFTSKDYVQGFAQLLIEQADSMPVVAEITPTGSTIEFTNLKMGYYLIDSTLGSLCVLDTVDGEISVTAKNSEPTVNKKVEEDSLANGYGEKNDADIGQVINFKATLNVPAGTENLIFHDSMSDGLTFIEIKKITVEGTGDITQTETNAGVTQTNYTVVTNVSADSCDESLGGKCDFHIEFTPYFLKNKTTVATNNVVIEYTAKLNEKANVGIETGNPNTCNVSYSEKNIFASKSETKTYTFKLPIFKYTNKSIQVQTTASREEGKDTQPAGLAGAKFILSTDGTQTSSADVADSTKIKFKQKKDKSGNPIFGMYYVTQDADGVYEIESNAQGNIEVVGLDDTQYYLYETKAPDGYEIMGGCVNVKINGVFATPDSTGGKGPGTIIQGLGTEVDKISVLNQSGTRLPATGGIGTTIFYVVGSILLVGATILLIVKKRMNDEK